MFLNNFKKFFSTAKVDMRVLKQEVAANKVIVYSKSTCPFCSETKKVFNAGKITYKLVELDQIANGANI